MGVYYNNDLNFENALYVMRQLNVALIRDIFKLKRIFVQSKLTFVVGLAMMGWKVAN